jgi:hypothetical protein
VHLSALGVDVNSCVAVSTTNELVILERFAQWFATKTIKQPEKMMVRTKIGHVCVLSVEVWKLFHLTECIYH